MTFLLTDSTKPSEFWLAVTLFWWGFWLAGPAESYISSQQGVTSFLSMVVPLPLWGLLFLITGGAQCLAVIYESSLRVVFAAVQFLLWLFFAIIFGLAQFYTMSIVICPIYLIVSTWVFIRLCFSEAERRDVNG